LGEQKGFDEFNLCSSNKTQSYYKKNPIKKSSLYLSLKPVPHQNQVGHGIQQCKSRFRRLKRKRSVHILPSMINLISILVLVTKFLAEKTVGKRRACTKLIRPAHR